MSEPEPLACSCRDRDTRVMRAIVAAASSANDPDRALPISDTDLPLPKIGSSGNNVERLVQLLVQEGITPGGLLMAAWQTLPGVPTAAQSLDDFRAFVSATRANVQPAYFARDLARQVHDALMAQRELERRLDDDIRRMRDREHEQRAKNDGTYWRERDGRRSARRPTHLLVEPAAWKAMKLEAHLRRATVGALVGEWVRDMASDPSQTENGKDSGKVARLPRRDRKVELEHLVVRLAISSHEWTRAKAHATTLGVTIARYVGLAVESNVRPLTRP